jgi:5-formyltetrahydrofolate cyclo-ligase
MEQTSRPCGAMMRDDTHGDGWGDPTPAAEPATPADPTRAAEAADVRQAKATIRRRVLAARRADPQTAEEAANTASAIARRVMELPEVATAGCVAAYVRLPDEPDTSDLLAALHGRGTRVLLPAVRADLGLDFREHTGVLVPGAMGTAEPPFTSRPAELGDADAVVVPAVAVDHAGRRLGRGGGSYDRALGAARSSAFVVAVVYDHELLDELPDEPHDRRVDAVVTPLRTWRCPP